MEFLKIMLQSHIDLFVSWFCHREKIYVIVLFVFFGGGKLNQYIFRDMEIFVFL